MVNLVNRIFRPKQSRLVRQLPAIPAGQRIYAIGDVHGRLDLFAALAQAIEKDDRNQGASNTSVILLGDLIDRGPNSARVVSMARAWSRGRKIRFLSGNHEEMFLLSFYKLGALRSFLRFGGVETLNSYGISAETIASTPMHDLQKMLINAVPQEDREFLREFETMIAIGNYLFVHAGIRPKTPISQQAGHDCRWIREPFLSHDGSFGYTVVHGHTVTDDAVIKDNRIGIDTGAFKTGKLTALRLEGSDRRLLQAQETGGRITVTTYDNPPPTT